MKLQKLHISLFSFLVLVINSCGVSKNISQFAATENYPIDTLLENIVEKKAMIVIAHDDDMCAMSGTISLLHKKGWKIAVVSFSSTPERNAAQVKACKNILDTVMFVELKKEQIRNDNEKIRREYAPFPKDSFDLVFNKKLIAEEYIKHITNFNPTVIFTLDNEIGGYGNPVHVLISQMVIDLSNENRIHPKHIYQSVFTDHMENTIMKRNSERMKSWGLPSDDWDNAKRIYGVNGMPEPTVQFSIVTEAKPKMDYLRSYNERVQKVIGFFIPEFYNYSAEKYFAIFNREFFRIIK